MMLAGAGGGGGPLGEGSEGGPCAGPGAIILGLHGGVVEIACPYQHDPRLRGNNEICGSEPPATRIEAQVE